MVRTAFSSGRMKNLRALTERAYRSAEPYSPPVWKATSASQHGKQGGGRTGPELRFVGLNQAMIDWRTLQSSAPQRDADLVSIVICVYNQYALTNKCLDVLLRNCGNVRTEVVVVNNGSDSETSLMLDGWAERDARVSVVHNFDNLNFALGNNIGFASTRGAKVVFLNNDTQVRPGWLEPLLASLDNPDVMGAQPRLLFPDGRVQCIGVVFSGKGPLGYPIYVDEAGESPLVSYNRRFRAVTAACFAMRAGDFAAAEGFDPVFINGQEDVDLCLRLGQGKNVFEYVANSVVIHHEGRTKGRGRFSVHNRNRFISRWRDVYERDDAIHYEKDGFVITGYKSDRPEAEIACWRAEVSPVR